MYYKMIKQYDYEIAQFTIQVLQELMEDKWNVKDKRTELI
jgi:hypothetical protein